jgi:DNA-binding response OmpR family regulator
MATVPQQSILLVEDDPMLREMIALMLSAQGYAVVEAADGDQALQALGRQSTDSPFSLVLLDLMLPIVDGLEVLRRMAGRSDQVPVVAMSASPTRLATAEQAGARTTLAKPFEMTALVGVVEQLVLPPA